MSWWSRKQCEQDLERELRSDLELEAEEQQANGTSPEGIVAKSASGSDRVRRARHRDESFQMAPLSWRYHSLVRAVVPEVSDLICAYGLDGARTWPAHPPQLHLALGPNLRAGTGQALPSSPETDQQKLSRR